MKLRTVCCAAATLVVVALPVTPSPTHADTRLPGHAAHLAVDSERGRVYVPVTGDDGSAVVMTDLHGEVIGSVDGLPGTSRPILTEDGASLVMALSSSDAVVVVDTATLTFETVSTESGTCPSQITETGGGFWVVVGCSDYFTSVAHIDLASGELTRFDRGDWPDHRPSLTASPSLPGTLVMASGEPARIDLFSATGGEVPSLELRAARVLARWGDRPTPAISPDGSRIAVASETRFVDLASSDLEPLSETSVDSGQQAATVAFRADGWRAEVRYVYSGSRDHSILVMRRPDGSVFRRFTVRNQYGEPTLLRSMQWGPRHLYSITDGSSADRMQIFEQRRATKLTVRLDEEHYEPGDVARVRLHLTSGSEVRRVHLYATPRGRDRRLVASGDVDRDGYLDARLTLRRNTTLEARYAGDADHDPATTVRPAYVVSPVRNWLRGYSRRVDGYAVYGPDDRARIHGVSLRGRPGDPLCFQFHRRSDSHWSYWFSMCDTLDRNLAASVSMTHASYVGQRLRVRAYWEGNRTYATNRGPWRYLRMVD